MTFRLFTKLNEERLANFFDPYVQEMHPAKDEGGEQLYDFMIENIHLAHCKRPQAVNLREILDETFRPETDAKARVDADHDSEPNVQKLREILLALIEDGNRHTYHDFDPPTFGVNSCARKAKRKGEAE